MRRVVGSVVGLVVCAAALVGVAPTASADHGYDASATDVVLTSRGACGTTRVTVHLAIAEGEDHPLDVVAPDGRVVYEDHLDNYYDDTNVFTFDFCQARNEPGRYTVTIDDAEATYFTVAQPVLSRYAAYAGTPDAQIVGALTLRGKPLAGRRLSLQALDGKTWRYVSSSTTGPGGRVAVQCATRGYNRTCATTYFRFAYGGFVVSPAFQLIRRS